MKPPPSTPFLPSKQFRRTSLQVEPSGEPYNLHVLNEENLGRRKEGNLFEVKNWIYLYLSSLSVSRSAHCNLTEHAGHQSAS